MNAQHTDSAAVNPDEPAHDGSQVLQLMDFTAAESRIMSWAADNQLNNAQAAATLAGLLRYGSKRVKVNVKRALRLRLSAGAALCLVKMMRPNMAEVEVVWKRTAWGTSTGRLTRTDFTYQEFPRG